MYVYHSTAITIIITITITINRADFQRGLFRVIARRGKKTYDRALREWLAFVTARARELVSVSVQSPAFWEY